MKKQILIVIGLVVSSVIFAQTLDNKTVEELNNLKDQAVSAEQFDLASKYKKAIELRKEMDAMVQSEQYEKAAALKKQLQKLGGSDKPLNHSDQGILENADPTDIEFMNVVYLHDRQTGNNTKLEQQDAAISVESYSAYFVAGSTSFWSVDGYASPVQITRDDDFTFLLKMPEGVDPATLFKLVRLNLLGKETLDRKEIVSKTTAVAYGGAHSQSNLNEEVPLSFKNIGNNTYEIMMNQVLLPGEYAFKMGNKWFLFGARNSISNNPEYPVLPSDPNPQDIYHLRPDAPNIAWLGVDCSLYRLKSDYNLGKEYQIKPILLEGIHYNTTNYSVQGKVEKWLSKEKRIDFMPQFGYDISMNNLKGQWIIPESQPYTLSREQIANHIRQYNVNGPGIGMIQIGEVTDQDAREYMAYMVFFDFDTREILHMQKIETKMHIGKKPTAQKFGADFLYILKVYVDKYYRKNL